MTQIIFNFQIKEGAEKLREVAKDRRALSDVASIVKKSNNKLAELKSELHELESQIILTQANSNGKGKLKLKFFQHVKSTIRSTSYEIHY